MPLNYLLCVNRLELEEQSRQKLQLEKVAIENKVRKQEEAIGQFETVTAKVHIDLGH